MRFSRVTRSYVSQRAARENQGLYAHTVPPTVIFSIRKVG
jgi:hypothetical protein